MLQKELTAGVPSAGGFNIPQILLPDYIKFLYANTLLDKLGVTRVPMPNGNFSIPRMDTTSTVGWVGETAAVATTQPVFGAVNLRAKKLKAMTAISNTLLRQNVVGLDAWVSQDLQTVSRIELDKAFLYGAGTEFTPRGLKNITDIQTSGTTGTAFGLGTPIDMIALLEQANVLMQNVNWIFSPLGKSWILQKAFSSGPWAWADEMLRNKTLNGYPFVTSASVEKDGSNAYSDFWAIDASMVLWGVSYDLSLEMSREGTYESGGATISAFNQDLTLIRVIAEHDFGVRQPKAVVYGQYSKI
jgi:HK97 family phage major capsid protein